MISYVKGTVEEVRQDQIVLDNHGIGYGIMVPSNVSEQITVGEREQKIYTYLHVREDAMQLYGFLSKSDLEMFKLLITVSGIGPKGALGVLSVLSANDLKFAILAGDVKTICSAPGIGKKTAEKTILELKDKVTVEEAFEERIAQKTDSDTSNTDGVKKDAIDALVALGYSQTEALKAINQIEILPDMDAEQILKLGLKNLI